MEKRAKLDGVELSYLDEGQGAGKEGSKDEAIVLIHGFAANKQINWVGTGWVELFVSAGYRVIAFDNRGHGRSTKFHEPEYYSLETMARDARALIQYLDLKRPHIMGYSMGARITARLALDFGDELSRLVMSGNGMSMIEGNGDWSDVYDALLAPSADDAKSERGNRFRRFADQTGSDLKALAECVVTVRQTFSAVDFAKITNPALVAIGTEDEIAGDGEQLAALMQNGQYLPIPGRDHMRAVGDKIHKQGVLDFLAR